MKAARLDANSAMKMRYLAVLLLFFVSLLCLLLRPSVWTLVLGLVGVCAVTAILYVPSAWIEGGVAAVSYRYKVPSLIAGTVFLAMASSAPEFFTSFSGVVLHVVLDIGMVTILWSALFNLCVIIGVCSLVKNPLNVEARILRRDMPFYGVAIVVLALLGLDSIYSAVDFSILVGVYAIYIGFLFFDKSRPYRKKENARWPVIFAKISVGLVLVGVLSHTLVTMGLRIVTITEALFKYTLPVGLLALIVFAPATSISDLFVSIAATKKGEDSTAIVNGVGSNTFDLTICLGLPGLWYTLFEGKDVAISFERALSGLVFVLVGYILAFAFIYTGKQIVKWEGAILTGYFLVAVVIQSVVFLT